MRIVYGKVRPGRALAALLATLAVVSVTLVAGGSSPAAACSCAQPDLSTLARQHGVVFVGTPVSVADEGTNRVYEVRVSDIYKGSVGSTTTVETVDSEAACGIDLDLDKQYMIVGGAIKDDDGVGTTICSGTQPVSDRVLAEVEQELGPATPLRGPSDDRGTSGDDGGTSDGGADDGTGRSDASSDESSNDVAGSEDDGLDTSYVLVGGILALAIGASFLLPRLRRRNRAG